MTTTVYAGNSVVEQLPPGVILTVVGAADGAGVVERLRDFVKLDEAEISAEQTQVFGPYPVALEMRVSATAGSLSFSGSAATGQLLQVVSLAASDMGATAMLLGADDLTNLVVLKAAKVSLGGTDYYIPLFGAD